MVWQPRCERASANSRKQGLILVAAATSQKHTVLCCMTFNCSHCQGMLRQAAFLMLEVYKAELAVMML